MEKKEENKSFTDVMEYNPDTGNWYIPGLWNGNPPMAPVNAGYSEAVYELKKTSSNYWDVVSLPCPSVTTTVYELSSTVVSQHVDSPAGELERHIVTFCSEGKNVQEIMDLEPEVKNSLQAPEEVKDENTDRPANVFYKRDQCQKKAEEFTNKCLKPAVQDYGHVVGGTAQRQCVVRRAGRPEDVVGPEGLHVVVSIVLRVLHLQGHDLLLLTVSQVIGRAAPLRRQPVAPHLVPLVSLVVKSCEGQDVEEEERRPYSHRHTQLSGIVPGVSREEVLVWTL
ncbi:hypothetical protein INR49_027946 [Caranx melampygus]|nr:hypothetical protein INR49_027946 [Caranx melampygus]